MTELLSVMMTVLLEIQKTQALLRHNCKTGYEQFRDEWIDGNRLCQLLNISPRTLQSLRNNQDLPYSRLRSKLYYRIEDVARILETNYNFKPVKGERYDCQ